jgi:hypothetical protein
MAATTVEIDSATGVLVVDGTKLFPIGFSNPPPLGAKAPSAKPALQELKDAGGSFIRVGIEKWSPENVETQLREVGQRFDEAELHGVHCWLWLGKLPSNLGATDPSGKELLRKIVARFRDRPALGAYKGFDEPLWNNVGVDGLARTYDTLKQPDFDPHHPLVLIQAPRMRPPKKKAGVKGPAVRDGGVPLAVAKLRPYADAFDITGADVFPISNPAFNHASSAKTDISVVGEVTRKMVKAAQGKPVWMTLQIAHSGTPFPKHVPCFPTLQEERFMAYEAIVNGARGLTFFGGHMTQVCNPADAEAGWNWTFWRQVLRPIVQELASPELQPALLAPSEQPAVTATTPNKKVSDVELVTRRDSTHLYVIAVRWRAGPRAIRFSGLPRRHDGTPITRGEVLFEYVQIPPPGEHPLKHRQVPRPIDVKNGRFTDQFRLHDVHVYRFAL